ncbi:MAG: nucleotidyl transferase AbiEii/AbiGii toxin family protein [Pseudomonadota bacterium]
MTVKNVSNLAASVHARLQNHARATKRPFQELLQYYAMERFLYRLSQTSHRARFVLKGALMLHVWDGPLARATKDLDFLGRLDVAVDGGLNQPQHVEFVGHKLRVREKSRAKFR